MNKIKTIITCLAIGCLLSIIGVGVGTGLAIALAFGWPQMLWVLLGVAIVIAWIVWVVYGRYQD
ncbi:hypothetical protein SAMN04515656_104131 [Eubacterium aggregans]|uniref:Uncharacterized protein n=1 Tax=Eubacterium aggregans TaxID=81409 RepID=A0A1H3YWR8_9FIRM|nr:hypothetical protein [Eubacterium aggregans]SEA15492.1 hypothetical protein SAMN04515656_104131 [Eubacterium aggregans]